MAPPGGDRFASLKRSQDPLVQAVLNRFPGAKVVGVTQTAQEAAPDAPTENEED